MKNQTSDITETDNHYKSYLMGATQITDAELTALGISIEKVENSESRKLLVPASSIESYKTIIREKLDNGFWDDIVGEDHIYFIFKMADGEIKEYEYKEENRLEIARLCSQLNGDPLEKTTQLLDYLAENVFYTEVVNSFKTKHNG